MIVMKKLIDALIKSNMYVQISFCAFYRFLNIVACFELIFLLIIIFYLSQVASDVCYYYILALKAGFLWMIVNRAKPSLLYPSLHAFLGCLGIWLFCSLMLLLYSFSVSCVWGVFLALFMIIGSLFLMNNTHDSIKKIFFKSILFMWYEWVSIFVVFLFFLIGMVFVYSFFPLLVLLCMGYFLVFLQLIFVKSLCMRNSVYYDQGS